MIETENSEINVENLMRRIREEVERRKAHTDHSAESGLSSADQQVARISLPRAAESDGCVARKPEYALADFLDYHDEDFVRSAYRGILGREPDAGSYTHYLEMLRAGKMTKTQILGYLRYSQEGKACAVPVRGLLIPYWLKTASRIPLLGYGLSMVKFIFRLPVMVRNLERFENQVLLRQREQAKRINALAAQTENALNQTQQSLASVRTTLLQYVAQFGQDLSSSRTLLAEVAGTLESKAGHIDMNALEARMAAIHAGLAPRQEVDVLQQQVFRELSRKAEKTDLEAGVLQTDEKILGLSKVVEARATQTEGKILGLSQVVETKADAAQVNVNAATSQKVAEEIQRQILDHKRQIVDHKHHILDQQRRLAILLDEARKRLPEPMSAGQIENMLAEEDHLLDAFYVSFEDRFRGTREDIKQRVAVYLPIVRAAKAGTSSAPLLDIGCGRGEWLELLQESGLVARGVDLNRVLVGQCQALALEVAEADAIDFLRGQEAKSFGAVTGMHVIEHIPFKRLIALFDEVLRVLKPGGVAIFETPNPENLVVGACNFYYDPTHLSPLPPEPMRYVMEARGFGRIDVMRLHPHPDAALLKEDATAAQQLVNDLMFGAQDYALVAYKS